MPTNNGIINDVFQYQNQNSENDIILSWSINIPQNYIDDVTDLYRVNGVGNNTLMGSDIENPFNLGKADNLKDKTILIATSVVPNPGINDCTITYSLVCNGVQKDYESSNNLTPGNATIFFETTITFFE